MSAYEPIEPDGVIVERKPERVKLKPDEGAEGVLMMGGVLGVQPVLLQDAYGGPIDVLPMMLKKYAGKRVRIYVQVME